VPIRILNLCFFKLFSRKSRFSFQISDSQTSKPGLLQIEPISVIKVEHKQGVANMGVDNFAGQVEKGCAYVGKKPVYVVAFSRGQKCRMTPELVSETSS